MASSDIHSAVSSLQSLEEDQLYGELGLRLKSISHDPQRSSDFALNVEQPTAEAMALWEDAHALGKRFFERVNEQAYPLVCGSDLKNQQDREKLTNSIALGKEGFATTLATLLIAELGLAPAVATVVALLLVRLFFRPALSVMCDVWRDKLPPTTT